MSSEARTQSLPAEAHNEIPGRQRGSAGAFQEREGGVFVAQAQVGGRDIQGRGGRTTVGVHQVAGPSRRVAWQRRQGPHLRGRFGELVAKPDGQLE